MRRTIFVACTVLALVQLWAREKPVNDHSASSAGIREDLSMLAGSMLDETNRARAAIKSGNLELAQEHVNRAEAELQKVEGQAKGSTMIPVYQEFVSVSILRPAQMEQAIKRANAETTPKPNGPSQDGKRPIVHEVAGVYTSFVVNTTVAKDGLAAAKGALSKGDLLTADSALADVQEGVQVRSVKGDMPLEEARENLVLARARARNGNYQESQAALRAASDALSRYAQEGGPHASEARGLEQEINAYNQDLQQNHANAFAKINRWWNTVADWSPYRPQQ
jgi:hypothetical protein